MTRGSEMIAEMLRDAKSVWRHQGTSALKPENTRPEQADVEQQEGGT